MFAGEVIGQAVTRHFRGPVESGICFGNPPHHLKLNGAAVRSKCLRTNRTTLLTTEFSGFKQAKQKHRRTDSAKTKTQHSTGVPPSAREK